MGKDAHGKGWQGAVFALCFPTCPSLERWGCASRRSVSSALGEALGRPPAPAPSFLPVSGFILHPSPPHSGSSLSLTLNHFNLSLPVSPGHRLGGPEPQFLPQSGGFVRMGWGKYSLFALAGEGRTSRGSHLRVLGILVRKNRAWKKRTEVTGKATGGTNGAGCLSLPVGPKVCPGPAYPAAGHSVAFPTQLGGPFLEKRLQDAEPLYLQII